MISTLIHSALPLLIKLIIFPIIFISTFYLNEKELSEFLILQNIYFISSIFTLFGFQISGYKLIDFYKKKSFNYLSDAISICFSIRILLIPISLLIQISLLYFFELLSLNYTILGFLFIVSIALDIEFIIFFLKQNFIFFFYQLLALFLSIFVTYAIVKNINILAFVILLTFIYLFSNLLILAHILIKNKLKFKKKSISEIVFFFNQSFFIFVSTLTNTLMSKFLFFFVAAWSSPITISQFGIFEKINEVFKLIPPNINKFIHSKAIELSQNKKLFVALIHKYFKVSLIYLFLVTLFILFVYFSADNFRYLPEVFYPLHNYFFILIFIFNCFLINLMGFNYILIFFSNYNLFILNLISLLVFISIILIIKPDVSLIKNCIFLLLFLDFIVIFVRFIFILTNKKQI